MARQIAPSHPPLPGGDAGKGQPALSLTHQMNRFATVPHCIKIGFVGLLISVHLDGVRCTQSHACFDGQFSFRFNAGGDKNQIHRLPFLSIVSLKPGDQITLSLPSADLCVEMEPDAG